jgi:hypothetical protein
LISSFYFLTIGYIIRSIVYFVCALINGRPYEISRMSYQIPEAQKLSCTPPPPPTTTTKMITDHRSVMKRGNFLT